jgi:hypothetical protein
MTQYDLEFTIYSDYRDGLPALKGNMSRLDKDITKVMTDLMNFISNISEWNRHLKEAEGDSRVLILHGLEYLSPLPVPPNNGYEIRNGLVGIDRDVLFKQTRNPRLTDDDLRQIMGMSARTAGYRIYFLFQNRNLPSPYNEPPPLVNVTYPKF